MKLDPKLREVILAALADPQVGRVLRKLRVVAVGRVTIGTFAEQWDVSTRTVYKWLKRGLPVIRYGSIVRIPVDAADAWVVGEAKRGARVDETGIEPKGESSKKDSIR